MTLNEITQIVNLAVKLGLVGVLWKGIKGLVMWIEDRKKDREKEANMIEAHNQEIHNIEKQQDKQNEKLNQQDTKLDLLTSASQALLRKQVSDICKDLLSRGQVTYDELEDLESTYRSYKALKGKGTIDKLYERVQELPIVGKDKNK